jgi:hypothetical protein
MCFRQKLAVLPHIFLLYQCRSHLSSVIRCVTLEDIIRSTEKRWSNTCLILVWFLFPKTKNVRPTLRDLVTISQLLLGQQFICRGNLPLAGDPKILASLVSRLQICTDRGEGRIRCLHGGEDSGRLRCILSNTIRRHNERRGLFWSVS